MPSRSSRRRQHKRERDPQTCNRTLQASTYLQLWKREARRRANALDAPAAWRLVKECERLSSVLDPTGELQMDLKRIVAEALASALGIHLIRPCRPKADRYRINHDIK
jgi:hypothetical protein